MDSLAWLGAVGKGTSVETGVGAKGTRIEDGPARAKETGVEAGAEGTGVETGIEGAMAGAEGTGVETGWMEVAAH